MAAETNQPASEANRSWWRRYYEFSLVWKFLIALVAGAVVGLIVGPSITAIEPLGDLFLRLLQMLVMPLVVFTLIAGASTVHPARLGRVGGKIFIYYIVTSLIAICVGIALAVLVNPGTGLDMPAEGEEAEEAPSIVDSLLDIVPENPFAALAEGNVLAAIFVAVIGGIALGTMLHSENERMQELGQSVRRLVDAGTEIMFKLIRGVLEYGPIGVFALIAAVLGETGTDALIPLGKLIGTVYGGVAIQIGFYCLLLLLIGMSLARFFRAARLPMVTAFVTRSSNGTLPVTIRGAQRLGIDEGVYGFSLPLGATINMDGTALYVGVATVFVANVSGVDLSVADLLGVVLVGTLASIGTAGVPGAGLIMLSLAITQAGLPFAAVALVAGVDALLDMVRTMGNITGDLVGTYLVARSEKGMLSEPEAGSEAEPARG